MSSMVKRVAVGVAAIAALAGVAFAIGSGGDATDSSRASTGSTSRVVFDANAGTKRRILSVGGLTLRASCTDYGPGRTYLSVAARTSVNNAARATVLSDNSGSEPTTYVFKSGDFDRSFGWYDVMGKASAKATGTFSFARPDGGQVSVTFKATEGTPRGDCSFHGIAVYLPTPHL